MGEPLDGGGRGIDNVEPGRHVGGVGPPLMPYQCRERIPERLGPIGHQVAEPHPFRRGIWMYERHLARVGGLDLSQRISAPRGQRQ